jgi:serine/threonine protein kinase
MSSSDRLIELLLQCEEQRRQGLNPTPEELCPGEPALQEVLRRRLKERDRFRPFWTQGKTTQVQPLSPTTSQPQPPPSLAETCPVVAGYEILDTLGKGGMAIVYKARQTELGRLVALKMVLSQEPPARPSAAAFAARRRRRPGCSTPTSCKSTNSASTRAAPTSRSNWSRGAAWPRGSGARR